MKIGGRLRGCAAIRWTRRAKQLQLSFSCMRVQGMMKTESARRVAEGRHAFMVEYLQRFAAECEGAM